MRFSSFAKKKEIQPLHFSTAAKNREICPPHLSIFEENGEIRFCIYVTALNDYDDFDQSLPALGWLKETKSDTALSPHFHFHDDRRRSG